MQTSVWKRMVCCGAVFLLGTLPGGSLLLSGCQESAPYPQARVTTPVGRPGICSHCGKKIGKVEEKQLITVNGIQYIVCDEKCAADLKKWVAEQ